MEPNDVAPLRCDGCGAPVPVEEEFLWGDICLCKTCDATESAHYKKRMTSTMNEDNKTPQQSGAGDHVRHNTMIITHPKQDFHG